ncbi:MAG: diaminopimelate epimerase [Zetaproteobacteria bacterium]|nr:MAG: diaminopimelate epimerase [Zetaproteobacteria bacterium]
MSILSFAKMQAQGNDFVLVDQRIHKGGKHICWSEDLVRALAQRRFGIGCDQILVLEDGVCSNVRMRIFNNDGSTAANCGNGLRCAGFWLMEHGEHAPVNIELDDRTVQVDQGETGIRVMMGRAVIIEETDKHTDIDIGNMHRVVFEATEAIPEDRNIELVSAQIEDHVWIDIIERGAGRTLACGSGACATAAAVWHREGHVRPLTIEMPGGRVLVHGSLDAMWLEGEVRHVFDGVITNLDSFFLPETDD